MKDNTFQSTSHKTRPKTRPKELNILVSEFKKLKTQKMLCSHKPATAYKGSNEWYNYYYYLHPKTGKYVRFKERFDMNRIHDSTEKLVWANEAK